MSKRQYFISVKKQFKNPSELRQHCLASHHSQGVTDTEGCSSKRVKLFTRLAHHGAPRTEISDSNF